MSVYIPLVFCGAADYDQVVEEAKLTANDLPDFKGSARQRMFEKGQSKRIWAELYKVRD